MSQLNALQKRRQNGIITMAVLLVIFTFVFYVISSRVEPVVYGFYLGDEWKLISEWEIGSKS
jgi:simple sugar transport system permease protein